MSQNLAQHQLFHSGFEAMDTYFTSVQKDPSLYSGEKVREIIESFGEVFVSHLTQEIGTLEREKLVEIFPLEKDFRKVWGDMMAWAIGKSSKLTTMPWVHLPSPIPEIQYRRKKSVSATVGLQWKGCCEGYANGRSCLIMMKRLHRGL